jgi:MoaA/NifB/PqqE/SkfB family radical SAM enzyme
MIISPSPNPDPPGSGDKVRMIAWEVTRSCNLNCVHCRAAANCGPYPGELSTEKCFQLIDEIAAVSSPVIILTGGEPLTCGRIFLKLPHTEQIKVCAWSWRQTVP